MPTLSDKLRSLGVKVGAEDLAPPTNKEIHPIEEVIDGQILETPFGQTFIVETRYPVQYRQGFVNLEIKESLDILARWLNVPDLSSLGADEFIFMDIETSGLGGGTGTYAFLIGSGRFEGGYFRLEQFFLRDPIEETAQLVALSEFVGSRKGIVTFNGKAFDIPMLQTRFAINSDESPFNSVAHIDLLHLARRLWRDRLPSRTLGKIEQHILGFIRTQEDVPGWMVPSLYFDYLRSGDARPLKSVFYHNSMDILSMVALLNHITTLLEYPLNGGVADNIDYLALGRIFQDLKQFNDAANLYSLALDSNLPQDLWKKTLYHWSYMEKRRENLSVAIELWERAATKNEIFAHIELAKYFEHRQKDYRMSFADTLH